MSSLKITPDGWVWLVVTDKAKEIFNSGLFELYTLHEDGTESLIETAEQLSETLERGLPVAIDGGSLLDYDEDKSQIKKAKLIRDNKLIAAYMGKLLHKDQELVFIEGLGTVRMEESYNKSWDALMPVLTKITTAGVFDLYPHMSEFRDTYNSLDIEQIHAQVVRYIEWYNQIN